MGGSSPYLKEVPTCGSATHSGGVGGGEESENMAFLGRLTYVFFFFF